MFLGSAASRATTAALPTARTQLSPTHYVRHFFRATRDSMSEPRSCNRCAQTADSPGFSDKATGVFFASSAIVGLLSITVFFGAKADSLVEGLNRDNEQADDDSDLSHVIEALPRMR